MNIKDIKVENNSRFIKLTEGENPIRIVSGFTSYPKTYQGGKPTTRYACYAIDRKDGEIRFFEIGASIIKQIQALAMSAEYGFDDLPPYDMVIVRQGTGPMDTEYSVRAARKDTALNEVEIAKIAELKPIDQVFAQNLDEHLEQNKPTDVDGIPF